MTDELAGDIESMGNRIDELDAQIEDCMLTIDKLTKERQNIWEIWHKAKLGE